MQIANSDFDLASVIEFFNSPRIRLSEEQRLQRFQIDDDIVKRSYKRESRLTCYGDLFNHRSYFVNLYCCPTEGAWRVGQSACFLLSTEYQRELMNWLNEEADAISKISKQVIVKRLEVLERSGNVYYTRFPLRIEFERFHTRDSVGYLRLGAVVVGNDGVYVVSYVYLS